MILVNYLNINNIDNHEQLVETLPFPLQKKVNSYSKVQDRKRCLFGKLILKKLLIEYGYSDKVLFDLKIDENNRPYIDKNVDFNISHSGDYVICAISSQEKLGIDIEKMEIINIDEIIDLVFHKNEIQEMKHIDDKFEFFYRIWTMKEAVLKLRGNGIIFPMNELEVQNSETFFDYTQSLNFKRLNIKNNYMCHLAFTGNTAVLLNEVEKHYSF